METRELGQTGLLASRIGLGLAALGRPGYINLGHADDLNRDYDVPSMRLKAHLVLDEAWRLGIRYFDAARSYGRAEEFLGSWLHDRSITPAEVCVASKWGYIYTADWQTDADKHEVKDHSLSVLRRQLAKTNSNLGGHVRIYQIHSATLDSGVLENVEVLEELASLKRTGINVGLTLSGPRQAETLHRAMEVRVGGERVFDTVQATWNLLEPSAGAALSEAHKAGMGVVVKEALANGRLTNRNNDSQFADRLRLLRESAENCGRTMDALALAAVLAQPWCDVVLSGASTPEQLRSNAAAVEAPERVDFEKLISAVRESPEAYWATRAGLSWN